MTKKIQEMSAAQMSKREDIVKSMKKNFADFRKRYGDKAKSVMYATATKQAMGEEQEVENTEEEFYSEHMCAQHVYHDVYGEGVVLEGEHDVPDADGEIAWYTVEFAHGKETVYTEDVMIMAERYHGHMMKRKKMKEEVEEVDEALVGNQHKIDMNKNNKIDAHDFKLLRKIKKTRNQ